MLSLWPTWVLPVLLTGVWVAVAVIEWRHSRDPVPEAQDWPLFINGGSTSLKVS